MKRICLLPIFFLVAGCMTTVEDFKKPVDTAQTASQKAFALYGTFVEVEEAVAEIVTTHEINEDLLDHIKKLDMAAKVIADQMKESAVALEKLNEVYWTNDGVLTEEELNRLREATRELRDWYDQSELAIEKLTSIVEEF